MTPCRGLTSVHPRTMVASTSVPLEEKHQLVTYLSAWEAAARAAVEAARAAMAAAMACGEPPRRAASSSQVRAVTAASVASMRAWRALTSSGRGEM
eukprot:3060692-Prymnesium_polylepis.2